MNHLLVLASILVVVRVAACQEVSPNVLCGPRCVNKVLEHFGKEQVDPIEMTKWLPNFDFSRGSSLEDLANFLESRGVYTKIVMLNPATSIEWRGPVIAHINDLAGTAQHFVTWYPNIPIGNGDVILYDGTHAVKKIDTTMWSELRTGVIMLTLQMPFDDSVIKDAIVPAPRLENSGFYLFVSFVVFATGLVAMYFSFK